MEEEAGWNLNQGLIPGLLTQSNKFYFEMGWIKLRCWYGDCPTLLCIHIEMKRFGKEWRTACPNSKR